MQSQPAAGFSGNYSSKIIIAPSIPETDGVVEEICTFHESSKVVNS